MSKTNNVSRGKEVILPGKLQSKKLLKRGVKKFRPTGFEPVQQCITGTTTKTIYDNKEAFIKRGKL